MEATEEKKYLLNPPDYKNAINTGSDFYLQFPLLTPEVDALIIKIINRYLQKFDLQYIKDSIINITKELINNAIKANMKRIYFKLRELDINKTDEYRSGMETFKDDVYASDDSEIRERLVKSNLVVRVSFNLSEKHIHINVINNIPILDSEIKKIQSRINKAFNYSHISEAFEDVLDDSEGAGLGLIMSMMLLKNLGLPKESFTIYKKNELTIAGISIPQQFTEPESKMQVAEELLNEVDEIPAFPKNIVEIQRLCSNPDTTMKQIAESISHDPGLTTSMLKLANSAGYITSKRVESIEEATKIIGIKGINTLLLATGVQKIMGDRYKKFETIWQNSYKKAFYAHKIAIQMKKTKLSEFSYLAALLSDIGYIVMINMKQELTKRLREIAGRKGLDDTDLLEEISLGMSHSTLGAMICRKWRFNDGLVQAIEYNHRPYVAPEKLKQLVYIVYLADSFVEIEKKKSRFEIVDEDVLDYFNLNDRKTFTMLHNVLKETYDAQKSMLESQQ